MKAHTGAVEALIFYILKLFLSYSESVINNNKKRWKFCMVPKHNLDDVFFHNIISQLNKNLWRREYTKKSGSRIVVSTRKNICKKSA